MVDIPRNDVSGAKKSRDVFRFGMHVDIKGSSDLFDHAFIQHGNAVSEFESFFLIVSYEDRRNIYLFENSRISFLRRVRICDRALRTARRKEALRAHKRASGDSDTLLLTAG